MTCVKGKVYLVGAGIGSEKYITLRGAEVIKESQVVVYDRLLNANLLNLDDSSKEFINVGKASSHHICSQDEINEILFSKAMEGKTVARLKGGDPYVFGRGGEEAEYLADRGIEVEVVPGITSGIAGLCFAGIPVTHRDYGSSLHLITGHRQKDGDLDFDTLAKLKGTIVFYMGLGNLSHIADGLASAGLSPSTPCAVISHGGYSDQHVVVSDLEHIALSIEGQNVKSPSLIVVGEVVSLRDKLNFFENKPLFGKRIVVTRSRAQAGRLSSKLEALGANVVEVPTISITPVNQRLIDMEIARMCIYTHIVLTSPNGVNIFMERVMKHGDARLLSGVKICAMGDGTSRELIKYGIRADFVPTRFVGEAFFEEIKDSLNAKDNILLARASAARPYLAEKLREMCRVTEIAIYDTIREPVGPAENQVLSTEKIDYVTFTSSSTVEGFMASVSEEVKANISGSKVITIGPMTSEAARRCGLSVYREAKVYNIEGLIEAITDDSKQEVKL